MHPHLVRVLTVRQPHAWGLIHGAKRIENRSWTTAYRGPLLIHAGRSRRDLGDRGDYPGCPEPDHLVYGAAIGLVVLRAILSRDEALAAGHDHVEGPWCWVTEQPRGIRPFPLAGKLGLFSAPVPEPLWREWTGSR